MSSAAVIRELKSYESRNVTFLDPEGGWPIVWKRARGIHVWDEEGRRYTDFTSAFGVTAAGHANPAVVRAGRRQMRELLHAMGDVHPHALKARLARELSRITFERWPAAGRPPGAGRRGRTLFCNSGFEAVEGALKTALLATGRPGVVAFQGAYHGVGYGTLNATHRSLFRTPFVSQLAQFGTFLPFPGDSQLCQPSGRRTPASSPLEQTLGKVDQALRSGRHGAVLVEPIQGRGGIRIPVPGFLAGLRRLCDQHGAILIFDEILTGFGRTGRWFACEEERVVPDVICLGKALTGGFPLSACVGRAPLMDAAWPPSHGEALHTSTFLGHPVGCAMALAQIAEIRRLQLPARALRLGGRWMHRLGAAQLGGSGLRWEVRGRGLMVGIEFRQADGTAASVQVVSVMKRLLELGFLVLPEGENSEVLSLTPPLTIPERELNRIVPFLEEVFS